MIDIEAIKRLEQRAGGTRKAAEMIGVSYHGCWAKWKRDPSQIPDQGAHSIEAHLLLPDPAFNALRWERIGE